MDPLRILVVDDDEKSSKAVADHLRKTADNSVSKINDSRAALAIVAKKLIDLVVTDLNMPNMSGLELIRKIRELNLPVGCVLMSNSEITLKFVEADLPKDADATWVKGSGRSLLDGAIIKATPLSLRGI